jgi:hypothetical protein
MENKAHLVAALSALQGRFPGLTYTQSENGKIIQVNYAKIDDPVKYYHPEGNLRISEKNDGTWEMSGDTYGCSYNSGKNNHYNDVCNALTEQYVIAGLAYKSELEGYIVEQEKDSVTGETVLVARRY